MMSSSGNPKHSQGSHKNTKVSMGYSGSGRRSGAGWFSKVNPQFTISWSKTTRTNGSPFACTPS
jgi:hypothetical protein